LIKFGKSTALNNCEYLSTSLSDLTVKMVEFVWLWMERQIAQPGNWYFGGSWY